MSNSVKFLKLNQLKASQKVSFTKIDNAVLDFVATYLKPNEFMVFIKIYRLIDGFDEYRIKNSRFIRNKILMNYAKVSHTTISKVLKSLEDFGLIKRTRYSEGNGYYFSLCKVWKDQDSQDFDNADDLSSTKIEITSQKNLPPKETDPPTPNSLGGHQESCIHLKKTNIKKNNINKAKASAVHIDLDRVKFANITESDVLEIQNKTKLTPDQIDDSLNNFAQIWKDKKSKIKNPKGYFMGVSLKGETFTYKMPKATLELDLLGELGNLNTQDLDNSINSKFRAKNVYDATIKYNCNDKLPQKVRDSLTEIELDWISDQGGRRVLNEKYNLKELLNSAMIKYNR